MGEFALLLQTLEGLVERNLLSREAFKEVLEWGLSSLALTPPKRKAK